MRILIVEDEPKIAGAVKRGLEQQGYAVDAAYNGEEGLHLALAESYDVIILDRMLPGKDGVAVLQALRQRNVQTPILFLTAKDKVLDRAAGLNAGADDYLVKPFAFVELLARIRALLRRPAQTHGARLRYDDLVLDPIEKWVERGGKAIALTSKELALLEYFMTHAGRVLSKETLMQHVWDYDADILPNTVEVYVGYLRGKLGRPELIQTRRGFGYYFGERHVS